MATKILTLQNNKKTFYIHPVTEAACTYMSDGTTVEEKLASLGDSYTKAETNTAIANQIATIIANAPSDFDTLKEIADWISSHESSASAMNSAIQANTTAITNLQTDKADTMTYAQALAILNSDN